MARADDLMLTEAERHDRQSRRRRLVLWVTIALVAGLAAFFLARPTRNAIKGWQARRHAAKAFELIEQAQWNDARAEAVAAYQLRATEPAALRAVARFLSRTRQGQAFEFWDQLAKKEPLTRPDLRDLAALALVSGETGRATGAVEKLLANEGDGREPAGLAARGAAPPRAKRARPSARGFAKNLRQPRRDCARTPPGHAPAIAGGPQRQRQSTPASDEEAWKRLGELAAADDAVGLDALVLLAQRELSSKEARSGDEKLASRLEAHPLAKAPQKLLAVDLQIHAQPEQREALIEHAIATWREADAADLAVLATWLNGKGEYERELATVPLERAVQSRELFLQRMDALGALGRWEDISHLLESERYPLDPVIQRMYLARTNAQLGQPAAAENNWQRALEAAAGDPGKLMSLAEYAEKNGAAAIADAAYTQAITAAPALRQAWQGKLRLTYAAATPAASTKSSPACSGSGRATPRSKTTRRICGSCCSTPPAAERGFSQQAGRDRKTSRRSRRATPHQPPPPHPPRPRPPETRPPRRGPPGLRRPPSRRQRPHPFRPRRPRRHPRRERQTGASPRKKPPPPPPTASSPRRKI